MDGQKEKMIEDAWNECQNALSLANRDYHATLDASADKYRKKYSKIKNMSGISKQEKDKRILAVWNEYSNNVLSATRLYNETIQAELDKYKKREKEINDEPDNKRDDDE